MLRLGFLLLILTLSNVGQASAQDFFCTPEAAWRQVRIAYPFHIQNIAKCVDPQTGDQVIVLSEPAPHIVRSKVEQIIRALFGSKVKSVNAFRHLLGYNGWVEDVVITVDAQSAAEMTTLSDDLALLALLNFGSTYKAEVEDIAQLKPATAWLAHPALDVTAEEMHTWLLGPAAEMLVPLDGGAPASLTDRAAQQEVGVYYSVTPGLVVALLSSSAVLNDQLEHLRRFCVDADIFVGAIKLNGSRVALVGRERSTSFAAMPPLRIETILLLASLRTAQLAQSYERTRAFSGKLLDSSNDLFGWDWAPILLSDELNDTELGSLLNFTDNMLKGWSESGKIEYKGFPHPNPERFPFGLVGAMATIGTNQLTYNWNTAGAGYVTPFGGTEVYAVRNTGSLPVSYFPEGSEDDATTKSKLVEAEDDAYSYFSSLRSPMLERACQYAALYQVFQVFELHARPPHDPASAKAAFNNVMRVLALEAWAALDDLANPSATTTKYETLFRAYMQLGDDARSWQFEIPPDYQQSVEELEVSLLDQRVELISTIRDLDANSPNWREEYVKAVAIGFPLPDALRSRVENITSLGLPLVRPLDDIRKLVLSATDREPDSWIRTPSIVVSRGEARGLVGGHNIGGKPTRVITDSSVTKGSVEVSGSYVSGRVIRVHPDDATQGRDLVRLFDREVGLDDANLVKGSRALQAKLREPPIVARPPRAMSAALNQAKITRTTRGAEPTPHALVVGERHMGLPAVEAQGAQSGNFHVLVNRGSDGTFSVLRSTPPPPVKIAAPNTPSMQSALRRQLDLAAAGPPPIAHAKVAFVGMKKADVTRYVHAFEERAKAVAGAGGKPPFGGDHGPFALADFPEPGRGWGQGRPPKKPDGGFVQKSWDTALSLFGRRQSRIRLVEGDAALLNRSPKWSEAEIRTLDVEDVLLFNSPEMPGVAHVIEVRVPISEGGGTKSLTMWVKSWFKETLGKAKADELNASVAKALKTDESFDAREAATRVKALVTDTYKAQDAWFHIYLEGAGSVTVVEVRPAARALARG